MLKQVEAEGLNINHILPQVLDIAVRQLDAVEGSIIVVNQDLEIEHVWFSQGTPSHAFINKIMKEGLAGWVIHNQQPYVIDDTRNDGHWLPRPGHITTIEPWSVICTPFITRERAIGAITIHKSGANQFDEQDLYLLTAISSQAASTIENARLFEQSQRQVQVSALLYEASKVINSSLDINEIMQLLLSQMNELLHAEAISIALVDKQTHELVYQVAEGIGSDKIVGMRLPSNQGISGWVMEHGEPVMVSQPEQDERFHREADERTGFVTRAMICAPMQFKQEVLGTIQAINPVEDEFTDQDLNLLVNLANIASSAIANAQQYSRTLAAEARYMSLFQDNIDPIILTDMNGVIVEANQNAFEFFDYGREQLIGKRVQKLYAPDMATPDLEAVDKQVTCLESRVLTGPQHVTAVRVYAKRTMFGENTFLQWIFRDISQEMELEKMRQDLMAMLFHDLQSPLGNVISSLQLMENEITDPLLHSMLDIALRSSKRLQTLVRSLLDIDQLEAGHPIRDVSDVSVSELAEYVWQVEQPSFERRGIAFTRDIAPDLPPIQVDEDMICRVLINLVDNAIKHSQESQKVTIGAKWAGNPDNEMILIYVSDQGVGIPEAYRSTIFEKFERVKTKDSSQGLGLGLAFCRLAVEAHGGRIWVEDAENGGARFSLTLPVHFSGAGQRKSQL